MTHFRATSTRGCSVRWAVWRDVGDSGVQGAASLRMLRHGHTLGWLTAGRGASRGSGRAAGCSGKNRPAEHPERATSGDNMAAAVAGLQVPGGLAGRWRCPAARDGRGGARDGIGVSRCCSNGSGRHGQAVRHGGVSFL